jgi:hypothetical protein
MKTQLRNILAGLAAPAMLVLPATSPAEIIHGDISEYQDTNSAFVSRSVDFVKFSTAGGTLTFDVLASDLPNRLDDPMVWLFKDDGQLDPGDWLAENDDTNFAADGNSDGSLNELDSFMSVTLLAGDYQLAIGSGGDFGGTDMLDGLQLESSPFSSDQPAALSVALGYQLTVSGDFNMGNSGASSIPEPAPLFLWVSGLALTGLWLRHHKARRGWLAPSQPLSKP